MPVGREKKSCTDFFSINLTSAEKLIICGAAEDFLQGSELGPSVPRKLCWSKGGIAASFEMV